MKTRKLAEALTLLLPLAPATRRKCRVCGCTDHDCRQCIKKTGEPCHWVEEDLCSACEDRRPLR